MHQAKAIYILSGERNAQRLITYNSNHPPDRNMWTFTSDYHTTDGTPILNEILQNGYTYTLCSTII